jgi:hypothetical protein
MAETVLELRTILDAADRAAAAEDFVSAEQHLRQAAVLQEQQLGASHPDLANTLNNLGIVCEYVGKPSDAEACYRKAYRIAAAALPADHPLVQTSGQNLQDFCEATGKPFDLREDVPPELEPFAPEPTASRPPLKLAPAPPPPPATLPPSTKPPSTPPSTPAPVAKPPAAPAPPALVMPDLPLRPAENRIPEPPARQATIATRTASPVSPPSSRPTAAIAFVGVVILAAAAWWFGFRDSTRVATPTSPRVQAENAAPAPSEAAEPRAETSPPRESAPPAPAQPAAKATAPPRDEPGAAPPSPKPAARGDLSLVDVKVCRSLSTSSWTCTPATNPAAPGVFFFYTRVRSPRDITVQHRWLVDGRLLRSVSLRIGANPGAGYRTYSRNTISAERRGNWTLELRDADGALLHEERFTVQ